MCGTLKRYPRMKLGVLERYSMGTGGVLYGYSSGTLWVLKRYPRMNLGVLERCSQQRVCEYRARVCTRVNCGPRVARSYASRLTTAGVGKGLPCEYPFGATPLGQPLYGTPYE